LDAYIWFISGVLEEEHLVCYSKQCWNPICTDSISCKPLLERSFGHFARVLVDLDLSDHLRYGSLKGRVMPSLLILNMRTFLTFIHIARVLVIMLTIAEEEER
jgi:hypothetical protein